MLTCQPRQRRLVSCLKRRGYVPSYCTCRYVRMYRTYATWSRKYRSGPSTLPHVSRCRETSLACHVVGLDESVPMAGCRRWGGWLHGIVKLSSLLSVTGHATVETRRRSERSWGLELARPGPVGSRFSPPSRLGFSPTACPDRQACFSTACSRRCGLRSQSQEAFVLGCLNRSRGRCYLLPNTGAHTKLKSGPT